MSDLSRLLVYSSTRNYKNEGFAGRFCIIAKVHYYANTAKTFCRIFVQAITSRALRIFSPKTLQLYTGWLNYLLYSRLCVYGLCLKPYTNDGFVLS